MKPLAFHFKVPPGYQAAPVGAWQMTQPSIAARRRCIHLVVRWLALTALLPFMASLLSGCHIVQGAANLPGHAVRTVTGGPKQSNTPDPVQLQQQLMRFADDYAGRLLVASDNLNAVTNTISQAELLRLKLNFVGGTFAVATGPNSTMNLLDMFVLATLSRTVVEEHWIVGAYGESARPMLEACREGEAEITMIAMAFLKPEQLEELRHAIAQWRQKHPDPRGALFTRALRLAAELKDKQQQPASSGSVFGLLMLDPLAGLDPAARELAETRLFAERALFIAQRTPMLLRWQTELLALETAETPAFREVRTNAAQLTAALERATKVAEKLPALVSSEREELVKAVASQESGLTNTAVHLKATLEAGRQMSDSVNTALATFDRLQQSLRPEDTGKPGQPGAESEPFRVQDYTEAAQRIDAAAERLSGLLRTFDQTLGSTNLTRLPAQVEPIVDYVFRKALLLVAATCTLVVASVLLCRRLRKRQTPI